MVAMAGTNHLHVFAHANRSLSPRGCRFLLAAFALLSIAIALAFALAGAWLILPFTGLELLALALLLRHYARGCEDYELLTVDEHELRVDVRSGGRCKRQEFNRHWTRIGLHCGQGGHHCRLTLRTHGRELEFGRLLSDEERVTLAGLLTRHTGLQPLT